MFLSFTPQRHLIRCPARAASAALLLALTASFAAAPEVHAQAASGRIEGIITDSVHARAAAGAAVILTRISPEPGEFRSALTDDKGRFHFDTLVAGRYSVAFATAFLDSLSIALPPREVQLGDGQRARVDFATPSGAMLRAAACPGLDLPRTQGAIVGQVSNADTDRPLAAARVAVAWTELSVDSALRPVTTPHSGLVVADSLGRYRLCGVPTGTYVTVQVQDTGLAGSPLTLSVDADAGVLVRDLSLSAESARKFAELDSVAAAAKSDTGARARLLAGTAIVTGTVRTRSGLPLADAQLRVQGAAGVSRTDSLGHFTLGGQPAGSQLLETRHVGYLLGQTPVELRGARSVNVDVVLTRIVNLDSIRVVARRNRYSEFEQRRKEGFGRFLDESAIEKMHPMEASDLFRDRVPGFRVEGDGLDAHLFTTHGSFELSGNGRCEVNIVINGIQHQDINFVDPRDIGAVEAYPGPAGAPIVYDRACGVVVIWTKR